MKIWLLSGILLLSLVTESFAIDMEHLWLGVKGGVIAPQNSGDRPGFAIGGTLLHGFRNSNLGVEAEILYFKRFFAFQSLATNTFDFSFGTQYRFNYRNNIVPYVKAGADFLVNSASKGFKIENSYGGHAAAGIDYFPSHYYAVSVELSQTIAVSSAITNNTGKVANFDPSALSLMIGMRFY